MTLSALLLSVLSLLLGLLPLWPGGSAVVVPIAALGVLPAISGLLLALANRSQALRSGQQVGVATVTLSLSVVATLLCTVWLCALVVVFRVPRGRAPAAPIPTPQTVQRGPTSAVYASQMAGPSAWAARVDPDFEYTGATSAPR